MHRPFVLLFRARVLLPDQRLPPNARLLLMVSHFVYPEEMLHRMASRRKRKGVDRVTAALRNRRYVARDDRVTLVTCNPLGFCE